MKNIAILTILTALASISAVNAEKGQLSCPTIQDLKISEEGKISGIGQTKIGDTITNIQYVGAISRVFYYYNSQGKLIEVKIKDFNDVKLLNAYAVKAESVTPQKVYLECKYVYSYEGRDLFLRIQPFKQNTGLTATKCTPPESAGKPTQGWYECITGTCPTFTCE